MHDNSHSDRAASQYRVQVAALKVWSTPVQLWPQRSLCRVRTVSPGFPRTRALLLAGSHTERQQQEYRLRPSRIAFQDGSGGRQRECAQQKRHDRAKYKGNTTVHSHMNIVIHSL